ncbi:MAG: hemolysin family protein [Leptolyngbyaceae bacterium]|nr:hemolysin family protein [Leptolyngbyaceae bacterium]
MLQLALVMMVVIVGSALCSGTEAALLSVPMIRVRQLAQSEKRSAIALLNVREQINRPIATIVILNNVFNIVGSILVGQVAASSLGDNWLGLVSGVLTFLIIIFGEIFPKTLGERFSEPIALLVAGPIQILTVAFSPLVWIVERVTAPVTRGRRIPSTNEAEIQFLTKIGRQEGIIEEDEAEMIQRVFRLNDVTAFDLMTPRVALTYLSGDRTLIDAKADIIQSQHSRIVVIGESIDQIVGIALKDELLVALIHQREEALISNLARQARFVPETIRADKLLKSFQDYREHLVVVLDEYGGVSGVVTLEDVLEVLTDEIVDETDRIVDMQAIARRKRSALLRSKGIDTQTSPKPRPTENNH